MQVHPSFFPDLDSVGGATSAIQFSNQGVALFKQHRYAEAEIAHKEALRLKIESFGPNSIQAALSFQAVGKTQLELGKLVEAEENIKKAVELRNRFGFNSFDSAVSRETLGQLYEAKGNIIEAKAARLAGAPNSIACGNDDCPGQNFSLNQLSMCGKCKCVYYCSPRCQKKDWSARHKPFCKKHEAAPKS